MDSIAMIIVGVILLVIGYVINRHFPEKIVQTLGTVLMIVGGILVLVGLILLLVGILA